VTARIDGYLTGMRRYLPSLVPAPLSSTPSADASVTEYTASLEGRTRQKRQRIMLLISAPCSAVLTIVAFVALPGWVAFLAVIADLLLIPLIVKAYDQLKAADILPRGTGSVHVTPDAVEIVQDKERIRLTADDIERIAVRPIGNCFLSYAVYAKVRSGAVPPEAAQRNWLPLFWTPGYTARIPPGLVSALAGFGGDRLEHRLSDWTARMAVVEFEASGTVEVKSLSAALGKYVAWFFFCLVMTAVFALTGLTSLGPLAAFADVVLFGVCVYQLSLHRVRVRLPPGPWSLRVSEDGIDVTHAGRVLRFFVADIETIGFRSIRGNSMYAALFVQLRPEAARRLQVKNGSLPLYWTRSFSSTLPPELLIALAVAASARLTGPLKGKAVRARRAPAPVYRGP
jgi:hypothetical protein